MSNKIEEFQGRFRFLSNFYRSVIWIDGKSYETAEHAFQAAKSIRDEDAEQIRSAFTPGGAKRRGRKVEMRADWEGVKLDIMKEIVRQKFYQNRGLGKQLIETGDLYLEEGNRWNDTFWGIDLRTLKGTNHLGRILMEVRDELAHG